jgi:hypothetical protein
MKRNAVWNCGNGHCVISGDGICIHPSKSGIQAIHRADPAVNARFRRAKKHLLLERMKREAANG